MRNCLVPLSKWIQSSFTQSGEAALEHALHWNPFDFYVFFLHLKSVIWFNTIFISSTQLYRTYPRAR